MAKNGTAQKVISIQNSIKAIKDRQAEILAEISDLEKEKHHLTYSLPTAAELVKESNALIDQYAKEYRVLLHNPARNGFGVPRGLETPVSILEAVFGQLCLYVPDVVKKCHAEIIKEQATGDQLEAPAKERRLKEIEARQTALWQEYEETSIALEAANLNPERNGDLPPEIYLEYDAETNNYSREKFAALERQIERDRGERLAIDHDRDLANGELREALRFLKDLEDRSPGFKPDKKEFEAAEERINNLRTKISDLGGKYQGTYERTKAVIKLKATCEKFLKKHGHLYVPGQITGTMGVPG